MKSGLLAVAKLLLVSEEGDIKLASTVGPWNQTKAEHNNLQHEVFCVVQL